MRRKERTDKQLPRIMSVMDPRLDIYGELGINIQDMAMGCRVLLFSYHPRVQHCNSAILLAGR